MSFVNHLWCFGKSHPRLEILQPLFLFLFSTERGSRPFEWVEVILVIEPAATSVHGQLLFVELGEEKRDVWDATSAKAEGLSNICAC